MEAWGEFGLSEKHLSCKEEKKKKVWLIFFKVRYSLYAYDRCSGYLYKAQPEVASWKERVKLALAYTQRGTAETTNKDATKFGQSTLDGFQKRFYWIGSGLVW